VDVFFGQAAFAASDALTVEDATLRFRRAVIATGARPDLPSIPGLAEAGYLTNESAFEVSEAPRRLLVIGGGPLGCEMAQAFCRFGVQTIIVQKQPLFLPREERDAAQILSDAFMRDGIEVRLNTTALAVRVASGTKLVDLVSDDYRNTIGVDAILTGAGRRPNVEGLNLAAVGIDCDPGGRIRVDDFLRTGNANIHAAGDVCLQRVAQTLQDHAARPTDLAARYGGEEFVLLFAETPAESAARLAEMIRAAVEALQIPNPGSTTSPWLTVSVGVATIVPTQLDKIDNLFVCADRAMYAAKAGGRNRVEATIVGTAWDVVQDAALY